MTTPGKDLMARPVSHVDFGPLPGIGARLDKHMLIISIDITPITSWTAGGIQSETQVRVKGVIKQDPAATDLNALRLGFAASLNAIMAIFDEAGAQWNGHPFFEIHGNAFRGFGAGPFAEVEATVELSLLVPA
jgi:hypothetical protein